MKKVWVISGGLIPLDNEWEQIFSDITSLSPDEIYVLSNTEVDIEGNWRPLLDFLQKWKKKNPSAKISVITPHLDNVEIRKRIFTEKSYAMVESVVPLFLGRKQGMLGDPPIELRNLEKVFSCYMFRPDESRARLLDTIIDNDLLKFGYVTYHNTEVKTYEDFKYHNKEPLRIVDENYSKDNQDHFLTPALYYKSFIDIVPEASFLPGTHFLTEKTIRAIMQKKPFISLAPPGFHTEYLAKFFKLKLYDDFIDYSFDTEVDLQKRIDGLLKNIVELTKLSSSDLRNLLLKVKPKLRYNAKRLEYIYSTPKLLVPRTMQHLINPKFEYELHGLHQVSFFDRYINEVRMNYGKFS